jgi:hypothetical protein
MDIPVVADSELASARKFQKGGTIYAGPTPFEVRIKRSR